MSKRKAEEVTSLIGIAGYGSDDDDTENEDEDGSGGHVNILLGGYRHDETADMEEDVEGGTGRSAQQGGSRDGSPEGAGADAATTSTKAVGGVEGADAQGDAGDAAVEEGAVKPTHETDPDYLILPPELREAPIGEPPPELVGRLEKLFKARECGKLLSAELRASRDYQNPDFLNKMVGHFGVKERGSSFPPEIFNPDGLPPEDHIRAIKREWAQLETRRVKERAERKAVEFEKAGVQAIAQAQLKASALAKPKTKWDLGR